jgi:hypothetical protein
VIHESESVRNSGPQHGSRQGRRFGDIEVVVDERFDDMVGEFWCAGIDSAAGRAVTVLGDCLVAMPKTRSAMVYPFGDFKKRAVT